MMKTTAVLSAALLALAGCATVQDKMPDWMPGSGAIKVSLTGAEEVPPVNTQASGSGITYTGTASVAGALTTLDGVNISFDDKNKFFCLSSSEFPL